jgi:hypothetical protein
MDFLFYTQNTTAERPELPTDKNDRDYLGRPPLGANGCSQPTNHENRCVELPQCVANSGADLA